MNFNVYLGHLPLCGIIGIIGKSAVQPLIIEALEKLGVPRL